MISTVLLHTTEDDLRRELFAILAETTLVSAKVADAMIMDIATGESTSAKCQAAYSLRTAVYQAAVMRLERARPQSATEDVPPFSRPGICY
jgi:hypothetical protein